MDCVLCISCSKQCFGNTKIILRGQCCFILQELGPKSKRTIWQQLCPAHQHNVHRRSSLHGSQTGGKAKMNCRQEWEVWAGGEPTIKTNVLPHRMHRVQNKLEATKKRQGTLRSHIYFHHTMYNTDIWGVLFSRTVLITKGCPALTFEAASKHTKPMLKSIVSPIRWLSIIQAYVLHCKTAEHDVTHKSCMGIHIPHKCPMTTESELLERLNERH